jgi:hypothetical protein
MNKLKLITFSNNLCTLGKLYADTKTHTGFLCYTIEREWLDNKRNVSCIPAGNYKCSFVKSPKFGFAWHVQDVPDRSHILFHKANRASELQGCIAPVSSYGTLKDEWAGFNSKVAYDRLMDVTRYILSFDLEIVRY